MNKNRWPQDKSKSLPKGRVTVSDSEAAKIWGEENAGSVSVSYTVQANDTLTSIATGIANAINASSALNNIGITASNNVNGTFRFLSLGIP